MIPRISYNWTIGFWREYPDRALFCELVHGYQVRTEWNPDAWIGLPNWLWPIRFPKRSERLV